MVIIFRDFFMFSQIFLSLQVKQIAIISNTYTIFPKSCRKIENELFPLTIWAVNKDIKLSSDDKILSSLIKKAWPTCTFINHFRELRGNYYAPCFYRINFVIPSYTELPWYYQETAEKWKLNISNFALFHMKTRCLKYFAHGCSNKQLKYTL